MKMAKATERDIDAAGDAMSVLIDLSSGYYPKRDGDECDDHHFDPEDPDHLATFYRLMVATLDASPGWPSRVIGGMCYVIMYDANRIVDPEADTLEIHPRFGALRTAVEEAPASLDAGMVQGAADTLRAALEKP